MFDKGDVFLVPLKDGSHSVGQVIATTRGAMNSCICAFFDLRLLATNTKVLPDESRLIAVQFVTTDLLRRGYWKIINRARVTIDVERYIPLRQLENNNFVGAVIEGSGIIQEFINAYYGLRPWDAWHDPNYLDGLLVSRDKRPPNVILTKPKRADLK